MAYQMVPIPITLSDLEFTTKCKGDRVIALKRQIPLS